MSERVTVRLTGAQIDLLLQAITTAHPDVATALQLRGTPIVRLALELRRAKEPIDEATISQISNTPSGPPGG